MKSLLLRNINAATSEKRFVWAIFIYWLSSVLLSAIGFKGAQYGGIAFIWSVFCLMALSAYLLVKNRNLALFHKGNLLLFGLFLLLNMLISLEIAGSFHLVSFSIGNQAIPLVQFFIFLVMIGKFKLSPTYFIDLNLKYIIFVVLLCVYNIISNFDKVLSFTAINSSYELALSSLFNNRNTFGFIVALALIALIFNWVKATSKKVRLFYVAAFVVLAANLILCMSRGGFLLVCVFTVVFFFLTKGIKGVAKVVIGGGIIAALLVGLLGSDFIADNLIRSDNGSTGRDGVHQFGIDYYLSHSALLGSGFSLPAQALGSVYAFGTFHSVYLTLLLTGGIFQVLFYLLLVGLSLLRAFSLIKYSREIGAFFVAIICAYLLYGVIETTLPFRADLISIMVSMYLFFLPLYVKNHFDSKGTSR